MTYQEALPSYLKGIRGEVSQFAASVGRGLVSRRNVGVSANLRREQAPALKLKMLVYCHWSQLTPITKNREHIVFRQCAPLRRKENME